MLVCLVPGFFILPFFSTDLIRHIYVSFARSLFLSQGYPWDECRVHFTNESYPQQISLSNYLGVQGSIR